MPARRLSFTNVSSASIKLIRDGAAMADVAMAAMHTVANKNAVARYITHAADLLFVYPCVAEIDLERE